MAQLLQQPWMQIALPVVGFVLGTLIIWQVVKLFSRPGWWRALLRVVATTAVFVLALYGRFWIMNYQTNEPQTNAETKVVAETAQVSTGTLTVTLDAVGSLAPLQERALTFQSSAPVTEIDVKAGDHVTAGQVLAKLDDTDAQARVESAQLSLEQAQQSLDQLTAPPSDLDLAQAQAQVAVAQASMYSASRTGPASQDVEIAQLQAELAKNQLWQTQINRDQSVAQQERRSGPLNWVQTQQIDQSVNQSQNSVTQAEDNAASVASEGPDASSLASANASLLSAQANLDSLKNGPSASDLRRAQIAVENAQLSLDDANRTLDQLTLTAPFDGIIAEQNLVLGVLPSAAGAMTLIDTSQYTIDVSVNEADVPNVAVGQPVQLSVDAIPDASVIGTITGLDDAPTASGQLVTYVAHVTLDPASAPLRPGMSAIATIQEKALQNVVVLPNRYIHTDSTTQQDMVTVETAPSTYTDVPVTIGERNATESQIVSGLNVGENVVILVSPAELRTTQQGGSFGLLGGGIPGAGGGGAFRGAGGGGFPAGGGGFGGGNGGGGGR